MYDREPEDPALGYVVVRPDDPPGYYYDRELIKTAELLTRAKDFLGGLF